LGGDEARVANSAICPRNRTGHKAWRTSRNSKKRERQQGPGLLTWLLLEPRAQDALTALNGAEAVATSVLSLVEVERALGRAEFRGLLSAAQAQRLRGMLSRARAGRILMEISEEVRRRAGGLFPVEPVRSLDAIHLSIALVFLRAFPDLHLLSCDERILENARRLGIDTIEA